MPTENDTGVNRGQDDLSQDQEHEHHPTVDRSNQAPCQESVIDRLVKAAGETGRQDTYAGKRESTRFYAGMPLEVITDPSQAPTIQNVSVHNASQEGVAFWSSFDLSIGTRILLRPFSPDQPCNWIKARVKHHTSGIRGVLIGAEFDENSTTESESEPSF